MRIGVASLLVIAACTKSGQHHSVVALCSPPADPHERLEATTLDAIQAQLVQRLTAAKLAPCTPANQQPFQSGAVPVAWYCGSIGGTAVEAAIDRPGFDGCMLELDLRAHVAGSAAKITDAEKPVMLFRDAIRDWFKQQLKAWWSTPAHVALSPSGEGGCCGASVSTSGAVLGDVAEYSH